MSTSIRCAPVVWLVCFGLTTLTGLAEGLRCLEPDAATGTSAAVIVDDVPLVHTTQLGPIHTDGKLVGQGDVVRQAEQVLKNAALVLAIAQSDLTNTVKLNVYLAQSEVLPKVQQVLARRFDGPTKPAVTFVVGELADPGVLVAMDAVATAPRKAPGNP